MSVNGPKKSLYVFLTSLLGILMFVILQRSIALIGLLLLSVDYGKFHLGTTYSQLHLVNVLTYVLAVFLGGWYGVWLGLYWYRVVYEQGSGGLFHGFIGKFYDSHPAQSASVVKSKPKTMPVAPKVTVQPRAVDGVGNNDSWEFDDLLRRKMTAAKTVAPRPRLATKEVEPAPVVEEPSKKVRKPAVKKKTVAKKRTASRAKAKALADRAEQV